jgi:tetratricopeptide (TPR) repeat protein
MFNLSDQAAKILWYATYIVLLSFIGYLPHLYGLHVAYIVGLPVLIAVVEISLSSLQKHISLFFARKLLTLFIFLALLLFGTALLFFRWRMIRDPHNPGYEVPMLAIQFTLQGFVVGIAIRELLLNMSLNNLFGRLIEMQRLLFLSGIVIFLYLMPPPSSRHGAFGPAYVLGFGAGLFAHFLLRRLSQRGDKVARHKKLMADTAAHNQTLSAMERSAVGHYVNRNWRKLRKLYISQLEVARTPSPKLAIVESCMYRIRGYHDSALQPLVKINPERVKSDYLNGLLLLQKALVLSELGRDQEMYAALDESLKLNPRCFLSKITLGLHRAEELSLQQEKTDDQSDARQKPITLIREAMRLNADERNSELFSNLIGYSIPLSWAFIQDTYGYALLKSGDYAFSKSLFLDCIRKEPNLTSAYLHLGEWYVADCLNHDRSKERLTLANLCFSIATSLEGNKKSRIARRSVEMVALVKSVSSKTV